MSVINETLDNLKQNKKPASGSLNPSSSVYREKVLQTEKVPVFKKSYMIPVSFALLVGALFYGSQLFFSYTPHSYERPQRHAQKNSWFKTNLKKISEPTVAAVKITDKAEIALNYDAKNMYYNAMALLNEGKEQQAAQSLQKIIAQYPDFAPAQKVYSTLASQ